MRKRYDLLAKHFVNLGDRFSTDKEIIGFLKSRTKRIPFPLGQQAQTVSAEMVA